MQVVLNFSIQFFRIFGTKCIESDLVLSDALNHAWNKVYIDGVAYHVDVTWDDPTNLAGSSYN